MTGLLVGDVGGTSVRLAIGEKRGSGFFVESFRKYASDDFSDFYEVLDAFLTETNLAPTSASLAMAGPPVGQSITLTNRPWTVCVDALKKRFGLHQASLVNDFTAMARSVPELSEQAFVGVKSGTPVRNAPILVIGPGTGLGVATLIGSSDEGWKVIGGEGGHGAFAAATDEEWAVFTILQRRYGYVPNEMMCAGIGLDMLHRAVCEANDLPYESLSAVEISKRASDGDRVCSLTCKIRAHTVMTVAGDLALANGALGGVVLAGGVSVRLADYLREPNTLERFLARGIQRDYMSRIPIRLLIDEKAPLIGATALYYDNVFG